MVMNGAGHQGELLHLGEPGLLPLVKDRHDALVKCSGGTLKDLLAVGSESEDQRLEGALYKKERAGRQHFPSIPSAQVVNCLQKPAPEVSIILIHGSTLWR